MKTLKLYIKESLFDDEEDLISKNPYRFHPKNKKELQMCIQELIDEQIGAKIIDLNSIDTSTITDMFWLFKKFRKYNFDLSKWDVSKVEDMSCMFDHSQFNGDISKWDVSNVNNMAWMFDGCQFNGDISKWDVSNVTNMHGMFMESPFNGNISRWNVSKVEDMGYMFNGSKFNGNISGWNVSNVEDMMDMFMSSRLEKSGKLPIWLKKY